MSGLFYLKAGDTVPILEATLRDESGNPVELTGADVQLHLIEPRGGPTFLDEPATIADESEGVVRYEWADGDTTESGRYRAEFVVTYVDGGVETFPNSGYHDVLIST